jgi:probable phosphoglycerate mutase
VAEARILLIRHGETEWNRAGRVQGYHADSPLTEAGREQARALAARLAREGIDALYSSDAGRTRETANPIGIATGLPVVKEKALRERNYGVFEGRSFAEVEVEFPAEFGKFRTRDPHYAPPDGESAMQFRARIIMALEGVAARATGKRVAVITHGGVLGVLYRQAMNIPLDAKRSYSIANASLNHFRFAERRWLLDAWGDVAHLPAESLDEL